MGAYLPLFLAVAFVSFGAIFVRFAQAPALIVAFYRIALASLLLAPFGGRPLARSWAALDRHQRLLLGGAGVALALHFATWIASLSYTTVASSVLLVNTAPLFTLAFSWLFLREAVTATVVVSMLLALGGAGLIASADQSSPGHSWVGDLLAILGAMTLSLYHLAGRAMRAVLPLTAYVFGVWVTASLVLALLASAAGVKLLGVPPHSLPWLLALAVIPTLGGHGLVNRSLRLLPAPTVGLFLLGEPVGATLLAFVLLDERPSSLVVIGGLLVLAALAVVTQQGRATAPAAAAPSAP